MTSNKGSGTIAAYSVEARTNHTSPMRFGELILTKEWTQLAFQESVLGVPAGNVRHAPFLKLCGLFSWAAANALRWWFHADIEAKDCEVFNFDALCVETRIVAHEIKYEYEVKRVGECAVVGPDDRSSMMPTQEKR